MTVRGKNEYLLQLYLHSALNYLSIYKYLLENFEKTMSFKHLFDKNVRDIVDFLLNLYLV